MYEITLSHARNPDIPGGYWEGKPEEGRTKKQVATLQETAHEARAYIERNRLGGGNWTGGTVC